MRVSRAQAEANRERVIETAAALFREKGFDGIGINELMQAAGLTRGGFYGQFASKEGLEAEACARGLEANAAQWRAIVENADGEPLAELLRFYLSGRHSAQTGEGCTLTALAADAARQGPEIRQAFAGGVEAFLEVLSSVVAGDTGEARRENAIATLSTMVGALLLSRAVGDARLSREIRKTAKRKARAAAVPQADPGR